MIPVCGVCGCDDVRLLHPLLSDPSLRHSFNGRAPAELVTMATDAAAMEELVSVGGKLNPLMDGIPADEATGKVTAGLLQLLA